MYNATTLKETKPAILTHGRQYPLEKMWVPISLKGEQYFLGNFTQECHIYWGPKIPLTPR